MLALYGWSFQGAGFKKTGENLYFSPKSVTFAGMKKVDSIPFDFSEVPPSWHFCFCGECPQHEDCLHFIAGLHLPDDLTWGDAIFPTAYKNGSCRHYKQLRVVRAAYGFAPLFKEVKQKDYTLLRELMKQYLGGHGTYYRYNRGERLLTPEQQEWILQLFARYGYRENLTFEHYKDVVDFS